jgi:hypothetical protein
VILEQLSLEEKDRLWDEVKAGAAAG